jgi:hypothetical protein
VTVCGVETVTWRVWTYDCGSCHEWSCVCVIARLRLEVASTMASLDSRVSTACSARQIACGRVVKSADSRIRQMATVDGTTSEDTKGVCDVAGGVSMP